MLGRLLLIAAFACSSSQPAKNGNGSASGAPKQDAVMGDKQSIYPADALLAWLGKQGEAEIRLPVLVTKESPVYIAETATVGEGPNALVIFPNDSTLGVPIAGKWPHFCPDGDVCMLMLTGIWKGGEKKEFQVREVESAVKQGDRASATFAERVK